MAKFRTALLGFFLFCARVNAEGFPVDSDVGEARVGSICEAQSSISPLRFAAFEAELPGLAYLVSEVIKDPRLPRKYLRLLRDTIEETNLVIKNLTPGIRRDWKVHDLTMAFYNVRDPGYGTFRYKNEASQTTNELTGAQLEIPDFSESNLIAVSDRDFVDFMNLVHEAAHVRFSDFLAKNFDRIKKPLGEALFDRGDQVPLIHRELLDFLTERYAHESQYGFAEFLEAAGLLSADDLIWKDFSLNTARRGNRKISEISRSIIERYNIKNPQVLLLRHQSLHDILAGTSVEYNTYEKWAAYGVKYNYKSASFFEQEIVALLVDPSISTAFRNKKIFVRLGLLQEDPQWSMDHFLTGIVKAYSKDPVVLPRLLETIEDPRVLGEVNEGLKSSLEAPVTLNRLSARLEYFARLFEPSKNWVLEYHLLRRCGGPSIPYAIEADIDPVEAHDKLFKMIYLALSKPKDMEESKLSRLGWARGDYDSVVNFWRETGFEKEFRELFGDAENFWASDKELSKIFSELQAKKKSGDEIR